MATFTICHHFVQACALNEALLANTLGHFILDSPLRIAVDSLGKVLRDYHAVAEKSGVVTSWLSLLSYREDIAFDSVSLSVDDLEDTDLYFNLCTALVSPRRLVCDTKQRYQEYPVDNEQVELMDMADARPSIEAAARVPSTTFTVKELNVTHGPDSPIIQGDRNVFRKKG